MTLGHRGAHRRRGDRVGRDRSAVALVALGALVVLVVSCGGGASWFNRRNAPSTRLRSVVGQKGGSERVEETRHTGPTSSPGVEDMTTPRSCRGAGPVAPQQICARSSAAWVA